MRHIARPLLAMFACLLVTGTTTAVIPQTERDALIALYDSTGGDFWDNNGGWLDPPGTECMWHGVVCDPGENHVEELHLVGNHLVGPLPADI